MGLYNAAVGSLGITTEDAADFPRFDQHRRRQDVAGSTCYAIMIGRAHTSTSRGGPRRPSLRAVVPQHTRPSEATQWTTAWPEPPRFSPPRRIASRRPCPWLPVPWLPVPWLPVPSAAVTSRLTIRSRFPTPARETARPHSPAPAPDFRTRDRPGSRRTGTENSSSVPRSPPARYGRRHGPLTL